MRFIVDAEPDDAQAVLAKMIEEIPAFARFPDRPGWGWHYNVAGVKYFVRQTKTGLSAAPVKDHNA